MKGGVTQFTVEKTSTTKKFPHHDLRRSYYRRKGGERGGKELIIVSVASLSSIYTSSCIFYPSVSSEVAFSILLPRCLKLSHFLSNYIVVEQTVT